MDCKQHISCAYKKGVWLPIRVHKGFNAHLKKHPYCERCGLIKNVGGDKAKSIGHYTNALIAMREYINRKRNTIPKFTQTQIRLIAKELESNELFTDTYGTNLDAQKDHFIEEIRKYRLDLTEDFIKSFI